MPFDQARADGLLPADAKRADWIRDAGRHTSLEGLMVMLFDEASEGDTVLHYLRAVGVE